MNRFFFLSPFEFEVGIVSESSYFFILFFFPVCGFADEKNQSIIIRFVAFFFH